MPPSPRKASFADRNGTLWACVLAVLVTGVAGVAAGDEIYKSVDAQGHVIYSDRPLTNTAQKAEINVQEADPAEAQRLAKERLLLKEEDSQRKKQQLLEEHAKEQEAQARKQRCLVARRQYNEIKDVNRIFRTDANGNRTYLTDTEADLQREAARQAVQTACANLAAP